MYKGVVTEFDITAYLFRQRGAQKGQVNLILG
jgi:hypothetical protein